MVTNTVDTNEEDEVIRVELTVPLFVAYKLRGLRQADIARATGNSESVVSDFKIKNRLLIEPLADTTDTLIGIKHKHAANLSVEHRITLLTDATTRKKISYRDSAVGGGIDGDKYRIYSNQATLILSQEANNLDITETTSAIQAAEARIKKLTGDVDVGNKEVIDV